MRRIEVQEWSEQCKTWYAAPLCSCSGVNLTPIHGRNDAMSVLESVIQFGMARIE